MLFEASVMHMNYAQEYNIIIIFKQLYSGASPLWNLMPQKNYPF